MIPAMVASTVLVLVTILIHYEALRFTSDHLSMLPLPPRARILVVVIAAFAAHTVEVWLYGLAYFLSIEVFGLGGFGGLPAGGFEDSLYFSAVTYTSLGLGDYYPTRGLRLIAGVEALNGLVLIGWSSSFTYLTMERYWPMHRAKADSSARRGDRNGPAD
jgi:hypothetical protein